MFKIGECRICEKNCLWIPMVDGVLADMDVCSAECLDKLLDKLEQEETDAGLDAAIVDLESKIP